MNKRDNIGSYCKSLRLEAGLTQEQLSALICYSRPTVSYYETGAYKPPLNYIYSLLYIRDNLIDVLEGSSLDDIKNDILNVRRCAACGNKYIKK